MLLCSLSTYSQLGGISGEVFDIDNNPVEYFNIIILSPIDSSMLKAGAFINGEFIIENNNNDSLIIKISSVGFESKFINIPKSNNQLLNLGRINLNNITTLNEIEIVAKKPVFKVENGNMIVSVKGTSLSSAGSIQDALKECPGLTVDNSNNISVFGKGRPVIFVNGKEIKSEKELGLIQSEDIKSIEIIRNPSSEYSATTHAVVRIETIRLTSDVINLSIYNNTTVKRRNGNVSGIEINNKAGKTSNFLSYSYSIFKLLDYKEKLYIQNFPIYDIQTESHDTIYTYDKTHTLFYGTDYQISKKSVIGFQYSGEFDNIESDDLTRNKLIKSDTSIFSYINNNVSNDNYNVNNFDLNYRLRYDSVSSIYLYLDYALKKYNSNIRSLEENIFNYYNLNTLTNNKNIYHVYTANCELNKNIKQINNTIGFKYSEIDNNGNVKTKNINQNIFVYNSSSNINDKIFASFIKLNKSIGTFDFSAGLRYEYSNTISRYLQNEQNESLTQTYNNFFPSIMISHTDSNNNNISLSYSRKIYRPSFGEISTYKIYFDSLTYSTGNPFLKPTFYNSIELSSQILKDLYLSLGYSHITDNNELVTLNDDVNPEIKKISFINISQTNEVLAQLSYNYSLKFWQAGFNGGITKYFVNDLNVPKINMIPNWYFDLKNDFKISKNINFSMFFSYSSKGYSGITKTSEEYYFSPRINAKLFHNKFQVGISWQDIFKTRIINYETKYANSNSTEKTDYDGFHSLRFSIKFNFNNFSDSFEINSINQEELNRL